NLNRRKSRASRKQILTCYLASHISMPAWLLRQTSSSRFWNDRIPARKSRRISSLRIDNQACLNLHRWGCIISMLNCRRNSEMRVERIREASLHTDFAVSRRSGATLVSAEFTCNREFWAALISRRCAAANNLSAIAHTDQARESVARKLNPGIESQYC